MLAELERAFIALCETEKQQLSTLVGLLSEELSAFFTGCVSRIEEATAKKKRCLETLKAQQAIRLEWMASQHIQDAHTVHTWLLKHPEAGLAWRALENEIMRVKTLNELSGSFISQRLRSTNEALSVLKGAAKPAIAYRSDGSVSYLPKSGRHIGSV